MIGIDTNVLVRYLVQDDPTQSRKATHLLESTCSQDNPAFISGIVLCELVWVLESAYGYQHQDIAKALAQILKTRQFHVHEPDILWRAQKDYATLQADFSDYYLIHLNKEYGCTHTVSFDKNAVMHSACEAV